MDRERDISSKEKQNSVSYRMTQTVCFRNIELRSGNKEKLKTFARKEQKKYHR